MPISRKIKSSVEAAPSSEVAPVDETGVDVRECTSVAQFLAAVIRKEKAKTDVSLVAKWVKAHVETKIPEGMAGKPEKVGPVVAALRGAVHSLMGRSQYTTVVTLFKMAVASAEAAPASVGGFLAFFAQTTNNYVTQCVQALGAYLKGKNMLEWAANSGVSEKVAEAVESVWAKFLAENPVEGLRLE
jgi:hypothetical protein